jgi:hypothetical protein
MADFWIKVTTCPGDGEKREIAADLERAIYAAADCRPWVVRIAESPDGVEALEREELLAVGGMRRRAAR